jgi:hypothetical protein
MTTNYPVQVEVRLRPIWHDNPPEINVGINNDIDRVILSNAQTFYYTANCATTSTVTVELLNKTNADTVPGTELDKAVIVESISFFGITDPRFVWLGVYEPCYPEPWATNQQKNGVVLKQHLTNHNYLGWNGKWTLTFDLPVFTWIHRVQNLGWIYD